MKKLIAMLIAIIAGVAGYAQEVDLNALAQRVASLESQITSLQEKVNEVTAQNLALKKHLGYLPTKAEFKDANNVTHKLIECIGDSNTGNIDITILVEFEGFGESKFQNESPLLVLDNGNQVGLQNWLKNEMECTMAGKGYNDCFQLFSKTPLEEKIKVKGISPEVKYIRVLNTPNYQKGGAEFRNIPIKWQ